jgi:glycosyltransferase involved in cell wall biosynthesis
VEVEHLVQDSCSDDGTQDWLPQDRRVRAFVEKDTGMYDAVNRGWRRATGQVLAYLNCDEQYLPGALSAVAGLFQGYPDTDVVLADSVVTDAAGNYTCHRLSLVPGRSGIWVRFPVLTSSLFLHRRVVEQGICFDTKWRDLGDWFWVKEMVDRGLRMKVLPRVTSVFTDTGENMNLKPNALRERKLKWSMAPRSVKLLKYPLLAHYRLRIALRLPSLQKPFEYALYTLDSPEHRVTRKAERPTSFWRGRSIGL